MKNSEVIQRVNDAVQTFVDMITNLFKEKAEIHSLSKLMRDEVSVWLLRGVTVGVEDTVNETARDINSSFDDVLSQVDTLGTFNQQIELLREFSPQSFSQISDKQNSVAI